jgi:hypothetical protein
MSPRSLAGLIVVSWVVIALLSVMLGGTAPLPPEWLRSWTLLFGAVISTTVGSIALWSLPKILMGLEKKA